MRLSIRIKSFLLVVTFLLLFSQHYVHPCDMLCLCIGHLYFYVNKYFTRKHFNWFNSYQVNCLIGDDVHLNTFIIKALIMSACLTSCKGLGVDST